ncbi:hypothetical protein bAD24_p00735 (plasmid) [Burkholderia sp. AD24]|nr:hypothetical protein bAD24_p00735 [Burkholderia sp. AD24]
MDSNQAESVAALVRFKRPRRLFAKEFTRAAWFGPCVYLLYRFFILPGGAILLARSPVGNYTILVNYGPAAVFLGAMFLLHRRYFADSINFVGSFRAKDVIVGAAAISALYVATNCIAVWIHQPREPIMEGMFRSLTPAQTSFLIGSLLCLPPIVEELAFRHFLASFFPFRKSIGWAFVAVILTALWFTHMHSYVYLTSDVTIFLMGIILGLARVRTLGMVLPICLHAYSIGFALLADFVRTSYAG